MLLLDKTGFNNMERWFSRALNLVVPCLTYLLAVQARQRVEHQPEQSLRIVICRKTRDPTLQDPPLLQRQQPRPLVMKTVIYMY